MLMLAILAIMSASCGDDGGSSSQDNFSSRIYLLPAESATLTPVGEDSANDQDFDYVLTLNGVEPSALWYTDRPFRDAGEDTAQAYINDIWTKAYGSVPPNATLQGYILLTGTLDGIYVTLMSPEYDADTGVLTFNVKLLNHTLEQRPESEITFTNPVMNVLNNVIDQDEVSAFIQYSGQAQVTPTAEGYEVTLDNVGEETIWVDNAPGTYSDKSDMAYFLANWDNYFQDNPPNAALYGETDAGSLEVYFLTLTNPVYSKESGRLTYMATSLGQPTGSFEPLHDVMLGIDSVQPSALRFPIPAKGTCYAAFGPGYDEATANKSYIFFGSDIARKQMGSLWGTQSYLSVSCAPNCRNDLQTMKDMGINLIRLYDWDNRNDHSQFLNHCQSLGIKVLVSISNYLPKNPQVWNEQIPLYLSKRNYGNSSETDWHPAVAGVIVSNEPFLDSTFDGPTLYANAIGLVAQLLATANSKGFSKNIPVGIPLAFIPRGAPFADNGANMPCWNSFNQLLTDPRVEPYKDRLMLCANTQNDKVYLFENAEATGRGWVQQTYEKFQMPILFTEIGKSRQNSDYSPAFVQNQLQGAIAYQQSHPEQLLGACHFQFSDKVWKQTPNDSDSEGAFGAFHHGVILKSIPCQKSDFDFFPDVSVLNPDGTENFGTLNIDQLEQTGTYNGVINAYQ